MQEQLEDPAQEARHLQRCINDLVSVLSLSAIWRGSEPAQIVETLLDVLLRMLNLDFAYGRLNEAFGEMPLEILRIAEGCQLNLSPEELRNILGSFFSADAHTLPRIRSRLGSEEMSIFPVPLGIHGDIGVLVVGSDRTVFPQKTESLLLSVAANQASIGLREGQLLREKQRIADELDRRVEQRTAELAAANAELQLQVGLLQHLPVSAWTLKPDGTPDFVNQVWLDFSGQSLDFVRSHPEAWMTAIHPEDREIAAKTFWEGVHSGKSFEFETRSLRAQDGTYRWHLQRAVALRDAEGKILKFVGTTTDIDDQKRAQEELRASEGKLQRVIDTIPTLAWCNLPDGSNEFLSQSWHAYTGLSPEEAHGWGWAVAFHPEDLPPLMEKWQKMLVSGESGEIEARLRRHDGVFRWFLIRAQAFRDDSGKIVRWYGTSTDIEDRKRAEDALRTAHAQVLYSEERWRSVFQNSAVGVAVTELNGRFIATNPVFQKMVGYDEDELQQLTFLDLTHEDHLEENRILIGELLSEKRQQFQIEKRYRRKDGQIVWARNNVSIMPASDRMPRHLMALSEDITLRKLSEEALAQARSELARVMQVMTMGQLAASIAHEVNQPLSGIITNAGTCLRMLDANPPNVEGARETVRRTIRDGHRASDVITRLRTLYSKKEPALESMDLNEAAREVAALSSAEIQRRGVTLRQELAEDLPPALGDRVQLQQVIVNLLRNAADAMNTVDDRPRELLVRTERDGENRVRLTVKDSGVGFTPQAAGKIFEAFYTTKTDGMGIGLSISRSIIEAHQGRIWATPNDGPGATFAFSIPCRPEDLAEGKPRHSGQSIVGAA